MQGYPVFNRIRGLFARYADRHLIFDAPSMRLQDAEDRFLGNVDRVSLVGNRIRLEGWCIASQLRLIWRGGQAAQRPHLIRDDVAAALDIDPEVGFAVEAPAGAGPYQLVLDMGPAEVIYPFEEPAGPALYRARQRLKWRFARDLLRIAPAAWRWHRTGDPAYRAQIKIRLGLDAVPQAGTMDVRLFQRDGQEQRLPQDLAITIVLPVYNAFELLPEALDRVERHTDLPWHLILIEDSSTDRAVRPFLRDWAACRQDRVTLLENDRNLGFIGSVNKGLEKALNRGNHVVLLNSDALVPQAWASRLIRPILSHDHVASVTPMSNDAEIFTVPEICRRTMLEPGQGDAIDAVARRISPEAPLPEVPTGVGFCMALNSAYLRKLPTLDESFGRGYGEEVDWCQKARTLGGRHLGLPGLFVEHRGGESFGSEEKRALVLKNNRIITGRYPSYDREVQDFIQSDPLVTARVALAIAHLAARASGPVPVYMAHSLGGGAENHLQATIDARLAREQSAIVLRVGGTERFQVEIRTPEGEVSGMTDSLDFLQELLAPIEALRVVYSCGVGDPDPAGLPDILLALRRDGSEDGLEVLFHDFFPISPSYCLLDKDGVYRGAVTRDRADPAHSVRRTDGTHVGLAAWQEAWGRVLAAADQVSVFSRDSHDQVLAAYPDLSDRIVLTPHNLLEKVPPLAVPEIDKTVIGVLGNIGYQKGAAVLSDLTRRIQDRPDLALVLLGNLDPNYSLPASVPIHGNYRIGDIGRLVQHYGITCWLIPSIWPETFSYTTHECLATGLPVYAFDIGAQGGAVARAPNGHPIPFAPDGDLVHNILEKIECAGEVRDE
ncbi:glycosyltransferase [Aliiroseovarius sp.]|uniref:glycosyltransferase n=1 Tax=Aliiroseovarius sp. TaxID=1872442 RepID=UPI002629D432|nr:glycosyltransferase [Aliiroseovarius sp.]